MFPPKILLSCLFYVYIFYSRKKINDYDSKVG